MQKGCSCGAGELSEFAVVDWDDLSALATATGATLTSGTTAAATKGHATTKLFVGDGVIGVAQGTDSGDQGCVVIPIAGIPVKVCWTITDNSALPKVNVTIELKVSVGGTQFFTITYKVECANVLDPSTCQVTVINQAASAGGIRGRCNWGCLRRCAPDCIYCGTSKWCWAACAASCVWRCCR